MSKSIICPFHRVWLLAQFWSGRVIKVSDLPSPRLNPFPRPRFPPNPTPSTECRDSTKLAKDFPRWWNTWAIWEKEKDLSDPSFLKVFSQFMARWVIWYKEKEPSNPSFLEYLRLGFFRHLMIGTLHNLFFTHTYILTYKDMATVLSTQTKNLLTPPWPILISSEFFAF